MNKRQKISLKLLIGIFLLITACNNPKNEIVNTPSNNIQNIIFSMDEEPFSVETEMQTRIERMFAQPIKVTLSDDIEAEVNVEHDPVPSKLLTCTIKSGNSYTIVVFKASTNQQVAETKGHFDVSTGKFIYDTNSKPIQIESGNYDFICYTHQYVNRLGNQLNIKAENASKAFIGRKENIQILQQKQQKIAFTMKHVGVQVRTKLGAFMSLDNVKGTLAYIAGSMAASTNYDMQSGQYTLDSNKNIITNNTVQSYKDVTATIRDNDIEEDFTFGTGSNYISVLAGTKPEQLTLALTGTLYNKTLNIPAKRLQAGNAFVQNGSYTISIKLMPRVKYLFEDGKTGYLNDTDRKQHVAIAAVIEDGLAIALWSSSNNAIWTTKRPTINSKKYKNQKSSIEDPISGLYWTWDPKGSWDKVTVKANQKTTFPAFYYAGKFYTELPAKLGGRTLASKLNKDGVWFLASQYEWTKVVAKLAMGSPIEYEDDPTRAHVWHIKGGFLNYIFKAANGISITKESYGHYWQSSKYEDQYETFRPSFDSSSVFFWTYSRDFESHIRAFVKY